MSQKTLKESNQKVMEKCLLETKEIKDYRTRMKSRFGIDPLTDHEKFPVREGDFSWSKFRTSLDSQLKEADTSSAFGLFLMGGIQNVSMDAYAHAETTYDQWVTTRQSTHDSEAWLLNAGVAFPRQVGPSEKYPEVSGATTATRLKNLKFGALYVVERELLEDDQTGTFSRNASNLGVYMRLLVEILCYAKLASVPGANYMDYNIPTSETRPVDESLWPWSQAFVGGGSNRPAAFGRMSQASIQSAITQGMSQKNLLGINMMVNYDKIIVSPASAFDIAVLMNSAFYPTGASAAGAVGGALAINPIKGILDPITARFMFGPTGQVGVWTSPPWYLVDSKRDGFVLQVREPITMEQEAQNAGASFEFDHYRFKARSRMNADFLEPRFFYQGNDGSAA